MTHATDPIRNNEPYEAIEWPTLTRTVAQIGSACVVQGAGDFDLEDLAVVRRRFPGRYVSLDGDVITVWPQCGPAR
ncbi:hypothetical protein [Streptomyces sp. S.PB5]|uniref:hypothetical protein n=1 Tax=Streptomyces sp. S.PB5 TaxID=3020844 RepID=UPI0025B1DC4D|nr:hypothetical protein [Streptomyces sp. S.PB5]MDN3028623.1 hypothetical protein [Streptomyces sp. S.PB5]